MRTSTLARAAAWKCPQQGVGRQEIGVWIYTLRRALAMALWKQHGDVAPVACRPGSNQLYAGSRMVFLSGRGCVKYERLAHERPVDRHGILNGSDGGAFDTQVCVAPYAGSGPVDISVGYIHSSDISDATVDYSEFPVVAPVDACREMWKCDSEERVYLYAGFLHLSEEAVGCVERADMVVYKSYFHSSRALRINASATAVPMVSSLII